MPRVSTTLHRDGAQLRTRFRHDLGDYAAALDVARDGRLAAIGLGDGSLVLLDAQSGELVQRVPAHPGGVLGVSIAPDGGQVCSCGQDSVAKVWSTSGELLHELPGGSRAWVEHVAWSPAGDKLATAAGRKVRFWTRDGEPLVETEPLPSTATGLAWRYDGSSLAVTAYGGVHVLPLVPGVRARQLTWKGSLISLAWSPNAKVIACGSQDHTVHFWRLASGEDSQMSGYPQKPKALAWDYESKLLATAGDASITVWDFRGRGPEGTQPIQLSAHEGPCACLAFSPDSPWLASGSDDSSVLVWQPRKSTEPDRFAFLETGATAIAWLPRAAGLLATDTSGTVCGFDLS